jgi:hypothetical protein
MAVGALFVSHAAALRVFVATAAATACVGAVLLRRWDQAAGRRVAELIAARQRDEWHTDERIAELEVDLEESRELRGRLENKLRAKRAELARLRTEHADLLRRYATAESERARSLEDRRKLALDATARSGHDAGDEAADSPSRAASVALVVRVDAAAFARADEALRDLSHNGARQQAARTVEEARRRDAGTGADDGDERQGRHAADRRALPALPVREQRGVSEVAAAVLPYSQPQRTGGASRAQGGFDFFGTKKPSADAADDLADVVGDEAVAEQAAQHAEQEAGKVIDLTAHDETEQLDLRQLRTS